MHVNILDEAGHFVGLLRNRRDTRSSDFFGKEKIVVAVRECRARFVFFFLRVCFSFPCGYNAHSIHCFRAFLKRVIRFLNLTEDARCLPESLANRALKV